MATRAKKAKPVEEPVSESLASFLGMDDTVLTVEDWKPTKLSPFDFLNEITYGKKNLIVDDDIANQYLPYIVNKGLSQYQDTVQIANYMNCRGHIPNKAQNMFLVALIPKRKRYDKWVKADEEENLDMIMEYYGYSREKALSAMKLLNSEQFDIIKRKMFKGGKA